MSLSQSTQNAATLSPKNPLSLNAIDMQLLYRLRTARLSLCSFFAVHLASPPPCEYSLPMLMSVLSLSLHVLRSSGQS